MLLTRSCQPHVLGHRLSAIGRLSARVAGNALPERADEVRLSPHCEGEHNEQASSWAGASGGHGSGTHEFGAPYEHLPVGPPQDIASMHGWSHLHGPLRTAVPHPAHRRHLSLRVIETMSRTFGRGPPDPAGSTRHVGGSGEDVRTPIGGG
jgi:hypothetical protein